MDNHTRKSEKNHTAAYMCSLFLMSKRSRKPIYDLSLAEHGLLYYICHSIDFYFKKHKKFQTHLYQSQIAKQCGADRKTVWRLIHKLIKKRLIIYDAELCIFYIGKVLIACGKMPQGIDMWQNATPPRSGAKCHTSKSSNLTNTPLKKRGRKSGALCATNQKPESLKILDNFNRSDPLLARDIIKKIKSDNKL